MEKYIIKDSKNNFFLSKKRNLPWSTSLLNAKEFTDINKVLEVINTIDKRGKLIEILPLNNLSKEKLDNINKHYKSRKINSSQKK